MVTISPETLDWKLSSEASDSLSALRKEFPNKDIYDASKHSLKTFLCNYFSAVEHCDHTQGDSIRPVGKTEDGGKILKVRWALPGCGRSGSLRLEVAVWCNAKTVRILNANKRREM